jgi:TonB family protein
VYVHATSTGLINLSPAVTPARPVGGLRPVLGSISASYPGLARKAGVYGKVVVDLQVNEYGVVSEVEWVKFLGARIEETVEQIVMGTVFEPATIDNQPVASRLRLPLDFEVSYLRRPKKPEHAVPVDRSQFYLVRLDTESPQELER